MAVNLARLDTWQRQQDLFFRICRRALELLPLDQSLPRSERPLNRRLFQELTRAVRELERQGTVVIGQVVREAENLPDPDDEQASPREYKRPDFFYQFRDAQEPDDARCTRAVTLECKRLGLPERADRVFNELYVEKGISRFEDPASGYAQGERSGIMIGYVQDMAPADVLPEVNTACAAHKMKRLRAPPGGWVTPGVSELVQSLVRRVRPKRLRLTHMWADIRHCYQTCCQAH